MHVIVVANEKGGVAKTTTVTNVAAELAHRGKKVLVIDLDKQAHATIVLLGRSLRGGEAAIADVIASAEDGGTIGDAILASQIPGVSVVPSGPSTAGAELLLMQMLGRERVLKRALDCPAAKAFDVILIDTSPSMGLLTVNGFVAATHVLVPVSCEPLGVEGLRALMDSVVKMKRGLPDAQFEIAGIALTKYDRRTSLTAQIEEQLRNQFHGQIFAQQISSNVRIAEAPALRQSIRAYEGPKGKGTAEYAALTDELLERLSAVHNEPALVAANS